MDPTNKTPEQLAEEQRLKNNARSRAWREANPDYMKKYSKKYRTEHSEEMKARDRQYHADHREEAKARRRQWSIDNKDKERAGRVAWYEENKDGKYLDTRLRSKYNISLEQYDQLLKAQGGTCALCSRTDAGTKDKRRLHVDHSHKSKIVRGLLCHFHNTAVGAIGDEDPTQFGEKIQAYLAGNPLGMPSVAVTAITGVVTGRQGC